MQIAANCGFIKIPIQYNEAIRVEVLKARRGALRDSGPRLIIKQ